MVVLEILKELAKEWRIWLLLVSLVGATLMLGFSYEEDDAGDIALTTNLEDRMGIDFTGGTRLLLAMDTDAEGDEQLELADQVRDVLEVRVQQFGLPDPNIRTVDIGGGNHRIQVEVGATNQTQIQELIEQEGTFEARMPIWVDESVDFTLSETHTFTRSNGEIEVEESGETYSEGERFELEGRDFKYINDTEDRAVLEVVTYDGSDIQDVLTGDASLSESAPYEFQFPIVLSNDAAQHKSAVAQNYDVSIGDGGWLQHPNTNEYARMNLYVDDERESDLRMSGVFQEQVLTQSSISGGGETREDASQQMENLQAILQSGSLPVPVEIETITTLSSALGDDFMRASILSIIASLIAVGLLVTIRYQDPRIAAPIVLTGAAEVYIILGFWFTTMGTLSLSAIAGIIAAVGTGVDDQIIIADESDREVIQSWTEKMKRAFFVIFTAAASTIGAMTPILYPGLMSMLIAMAGIGLLMYNYYSRGSNSHLVAIGVFSVLIGSFIFSMDPSGAAMSTIHDFAWTTILGILIGITITRPAFAKVLEKMND